MTVKYSTLGSASRGLPGVSRREIAVIIEPAKTFSRMFRGYDPAAVDTYIEALTTKQQFLLNDVESLRARLKERDDEAAALRKEVAALRDTSPSPHAMQHRMAKMLRRAVDEISEMQAEARAEAEALIAATKAEAEAEQRKHKELLADMAAKRSALEAEYEETKKKLDAELARMRAETQSEIDEAWQDAQQEREQLLADAKQEADYYREQARRAVDEASQQRIKVLEQLMGVDRDLEAVPATLESAYQEAKNSPEASVVVPLDQKISAG
jgi:cell division septum initiation protein DivIVA